MSNCPQSTPCFLEKVVLLFYIKGDRSQDVAASSGLDFLALLSIVTQHDRDECNKEHRMCADRTTTSEFLYGWNTKRLWLLCKSNIFVCYVVLSRRTGPVRSVEPMLLKCSGTLSDLWPQINTTQHQYPAPFDAPTSLLWLYTSTVTFCPTTGTSTP